MKNLFQTKTKFRPELFLISVLLLIAGFAHGTNMLHYPYFESDEGTYLSQAWAIVSSGQLAPYTYWYDHAPAGWFFSALWLKITGGLFSFGFALNSGRIFMLILHILTAFLLYAFARKVTGGRLAGSIATLLFSLSPLAIYFQRRLLLDNIMMFWIFVALCAVVYSKKKLRYIHLSAMATGIAILSKESAVFFIPIIMYLIYLYTDRKNRWFALASWLSITLGIVSLYFLYSFIKGELFPTGTLLGGAKEHVSLLGTLSFQNSRGQIPIWDLESSFWSMLRTWKGDDPFIIWSGIGATVVSLMFGLKKKAGRILGFLAASYWLFILRGGLVLEFYIIPLIPLLALVIGYVAWESIEYLKLLFSRYRLQYLAYLLLIPFFYIATTSIYYHSTHFRATQNIYTSDQTTSQKDAVNWILNKKEPNTFYAIDNYAYLDLRYRNQQNFANAEYYWKVDGDKDIKNKILKNDSNNIDYILFTPTIGGDLGTGELKLVGKALENSSPITSFAGDGWYVQIWGVRNANRVLTSSWTSYKHNFIFDGRVNDPQKDNLTTSEGQSYALLRSVWLGDKTTFDKVLGWTNDNLRQENGLFGWKWSAGQLRDKNSASDADSDIALALLFAYKVWGDEKYLIQVKELLSSIWNEEVVVVNKIPYLGAGNWAKTQSKTVTINPSYLSPASYRIFAQIDKSHDWEGLADSSYDVLRACTQANLDKSIGLLPPDWCAISKSTGAASQPNSTQPRATEYSYNAYRIPWRVALDYAWFKTPAAKDYLVTLKVLGDQWAKNKKISTSYSHDGKVWEEYESVGAYAANIGYFLVANPQEAEPIYLKKILAKFYEDDGRAYWDDPKNYYTQNWAWFGTALYANKLPNLYK